MRLLIVLICCLGALATDQQADSSEVQSTNKLTASKSSLNAIPSAPAQKTTLIQQSHHQYVPQQYVLQKPVSIPSQHHSHQSQQPAAMYIIAQPSGHHQTASQNTLFQQAVQQLLNYYSNNPQARYQLLQQQGGSVPQHQQITHAHPVPQAAHTHQVPQAVQSAQPSHAAYHHMPSGALHVIQSPHLDNSNIQHLAQSQQQTQSAQVQTQSVPQSQHHQTSITNQQPQAIYAIPASSQYTLSQLSPALLAQLTGHSSPQQQTVPVQLPLNQYSHLLAQPSAQSYETTQLGTQLGSHLGSQLQVSSQLSGAKYFAQLPANFAAQFAQVPAQYAIAPQFQTAGYQHVQPQLSGQPQFSFKQNSANNGNEYLAHVVQQAQQTQSEKSNQGQSSNYNPVYKTAYIKG